MLVLLLLSLLTLTLSLSLSINKDNEHYEQYKCVYCLDSLEHYSSNTTTSNADASLYDVCISKYNYNDVALVACSIFNNITISYDMTKYEARQSCQTLQLCPDNDDDKLWSKYNSYSNDDALDIRIAKAMGSRGYNKVRISVISNTTIDNDMFTYKSQFKYRWNQNYLSTGIIDINDGINDITIGDQSIQIKLPSKGSGIRGVIIADPCFTSQWIPCEYKDQFKMFDHLTGMLNEMFNYDDLDFFQILGDNFYDLNGDPSNSFFKALKTKTKQNFLLSVPGNHDFIVSGVPSTATINDQYGNGFMQFYGQDVFASLSQTVPYDFSINPDVTYNTSATANNFFEYNQLGNVLMVGYSGMHSFQENSLMFDEACTFAKDNEDTIDLIFLLGHWNANNDGATDGAVETVYVTLKSLPSCALVYDKIKYFEGHNHKNEIITPNIGFKVAAVGKAQNNYQGQWGIAIVDTTNNKFQINYFPIAQVDPNAYDNYNDIISCIQSSKGISNCYDLAINWVSQTL